MKAEGEKVKALARSRGYVRSAVLLAAVVGVFTGWLWWRGAFMDEHDVDAKVTFAGTQGTEVDALRLIAGADKSYWQTLRAGETARTRLFTGGEETSLLMQFSWRGEQVSWSGPRIARGAGYRIAIQIDAEGRVTEQHCMPVW